MALRLHRQPCYATATMARLTAPNFTDRLVTLVVFTIVIAACGERQFGMGIGRPPIGAVERPEPVDLMITEAFIAATDPAQRFVELAATGSEVVPLADLQLCTGREIAPLAPMATATGQCIPLTGDASPGTRVVVLNDAGALDPLALDASAGELGVVDAAGAVYAYLAWGADPSTVGSTLYSAAVARGIVSPGEFVSLPYPMTDDVAVAAAVGKAGCAAPTPGAPTLSIAIDPGICPEVARTLYLTEVFPAAAPGDDSWAEIQNLGARSLDLYGVRVCQPPSCAVLGPADPLLPGGFLEIHFGVTAPPTPRPTERYFAAATPLAAGEVVLYAPGPAALDDADSMLSYVRYEDFDARSCPDSSLAATAVLIGVWAASSDCAPAPHPGTESIGSIGARGTSGAGWSAGAPTPGVDTRCGAPVPPMPILALVLRAIERTTPARIVLQNRGVLTLDAAGWSVELGALALPLTGPSDLAAGAEITVELDPEANGCAGGVVCWADANAQISGDGEASLRQGTTLRAFLRWGVGSTSVTTEAVAAGLWPDESCTARTLGDGDTLRLVDGAGGQSPLDYE